MMQGVNYALHMKGIMFRLFSAVSQCDVTSVTIFFHVEGRLKNDMPASKKTEKSKVLRLRVKAEKKIKLQVMRCSELKLSVTELES